MVSARDMQFPVHIRSQICDIYKRRAAKAPAPARRPAALMLAADPVYAELEGEVEELVLVGKPVPDEAKPEEEGPTTAELEMVG